MNRSIAGRASFGLLWTCGVSLRLTVLSVPPVISLIQRDLNLSGTEIGLLSGIPVVVFAIVAAPGSIVIARMGVRGALVSGLLIAAGGGLLRAISSNAWQLYLTTMLMSVGIAVMQPAMAAAVREWMPKRSAFGTAVYTNGLIMGEIIPVATMLPFVLPYFDGNWRPALGAWSLPLIATAIAVAIFVPKSAANAATRRVAGWLPRLNSRLNWRIGLTLGSITSTYFCLNGFLPACLNGNGHRELTSAALTALNAGQIPASFLMLLAADKLQGKRWPYLMLGVLSSCCVVGIMTSASGWTVFWAGLAGFSLGAALVLALALAPLLCSNPDDVAVTSAAAFAISYGFAMLVSLVSGAAWDLAGNVNAALIPILLGSLPILLAAPTFARTEPAVAPATMSSENA
ncbi:CynX/NimT family MFS transporter [Bradyrhizobium sp.]|uniref:MFS transporter n=1 Tax=Bradyrhizobium sp. TaxID=376 RepID=UPI003C34FB06